ncbi:hypothetical protein [Kocuria arenosa]|uniref:hypothetical protein n=1 Tax=Kocuria arenosa TaxID=3071446 RepID=UPI0034D6E817
MTENTTVTASRPALEDQLRVPFWIVLAGVGAGAIWALAGVGVGAWVRGRRSCPGHHGRTCR